MKNCAEKKNEQSDEEKTSQKLINKNVSYQNSEQFKTKDNI